MLTTHRFRQSSSSIACSARADRYPALQTRWASGYLPRSRSRKLEYVPKPELDAAGREFFVPMRYGYVAHRRKTLRSGGK
jgi:hypothetical protein